MQMYYIKSKIEGEFYMVLTVLVPQKGLTHWHIWFPVCHFK